MEETNIDADYDEDELFQRMIEEAHKKGEVVDVAASAMLTLAPLTVTAKGKSNLTPEAESFLKALQSVERVAEQIKPTDTLEKKAAPGQTIRTVVTVGARDKVEIEIGAEWKTRAGDFIDFAEQVRSGQIGLVHYDEWKSNPDSILTGMTTSQWDLFREDMEITIDEKQIPQTFKHAAGDLGSFYRSLGRNLSRSSLAIYNAGLKDVDFLCNHVQEGFYTSEEEKALSVAKNICRVEDVHDIAPSSLASSLGRYYLQGNCRRPTDLQFLLTAILGRLREDKGEHYEIMAIGSDRGSSVFHVLENTRATAGTYIRQKIWRGNGKIYNHYAVPYEDMWNCAAHLGFSMILKRPSEIDSFHAALDGSVVVACFSRKEGDAWRATPISAKRGDPDVSDGVEFKPLTRMDLAENYREERWGFFIVPDGQPLCCLDRWRLTNLVTGKCESVHEWSYNGMLGWVQDGRFIRIVEKDKYVNHPFVDFMPLAVLRHKVNLDTFKGCIVFRVGRSYVWWSGRRIITGDDGRHAEATLFSVDSAKSQFRWQQTTLGHTYPVIPGISLPKEYEEFNAHCISLHDMASLVYRHDLVVPMQVNVDQTFGVHETFNRYLQDPDFARKLVSTYPNPLNFATSPRGSPGCDYKLLASLLFYREVRVAQMVSGMDGDLDLLRAIVGATQIGGNSVTRLGLGCFNLLAVEDRFGKRR